MQNHHPIRKKLILILVSLLIIGTILLGAYEAYTQILTKNALIQIETTEGQNIQIQGQLATIQNPFTKTAAFWIPWNTSGVCNTTCYIEVPAGSYTIKTAGVYENITIEAGTQVVLDIRKIEVEIVELPIQEIQKTPQQMLEVFIDTFPEYTQTKRKILSEIEAIIIYTTPIRIYDSINNTMQDTISTDEPILTRDTNNQLKISYK